MISVMVRILLAVLAAAATGVVACSTEQARAPMQLEGNRLTVYNDTAGDWTNVEIWLNHHFRVTVPTIPPHAPLLAPLDVFVAGYGQRFNFKTMQITDLRLKGKHQNGEPFELQYDFQKSGLAGALSGFKGKR